MTIQEMLDEAAAESVSASNCYQGGDETNCKKHTARTQLLLAQAMALLVQREFGVPWLRLTLTKLAPFPGAEVGIVLERGRRA